MNSFESEIEITEPMLQNCLAGTDTAAGTCHGVFIRAPGISRLLSNEVIYLSSNDQ